MYAQAAESFPGGLLKSGLEQQQDFVVGIYTQQGIVCTCNRVEARERADGVLLWLGHAKCQMTGLESLCP